MFPRAEEFEERSEFGCFYGSSADVDELAAGALACVDLDSTIEFVRLFTPDFPEKSLLFIAEENFKFPCTWRHSYFGMPHLVIGEM